MTQQTILAKQIEIASLYRVDLSSVNIRYARDKVYFQVLCIDEEIEVSYE